MTWQLRAARAHIHTTSQGIQRQRRWSIGARLGAGSQPTRYHTNARHDAMEPGIPVVAPAILSQNFAILDPTEMPLQGWGPAYVIRGQRLRRVPAKPWRMQKDRFHISRLGARMMMARRGELARSTCQLGISGRCWRRLKGASASLLVQGVESSSPSWDAIGCPSHLDVVFFGTLSRITLHTCSSKWC